MYVEFEDQQYNRRTPQRASGFYSVLLNNGLVKNKNQANVVLMILFVVCVAAAYTLLKNNAAPQANAPTLTEVDTEQAGNPSEINNNIR